MDKEHFDVANLPNTAIKKVQSFEKVLSEEHEEDIVLIAYQGNNSEEKN